MRLIFQVILILISVILISLILLQARGAGLSTTFGGSLSYYSSKRGVEKFLFVVTIVIGIVFSVVAFLGIFMY
ncbi:preprotein translocase subunit SecG [candidate division WWE3 bacterium CG09_land_8_20_14_0_10_39_24]|uniref:Protein-export membrane protein SecG n=2 Tax=Katanobacteria TaxID=422282 RepID=A0A2G9XBE3_UNCKA|nr:MAG: preprotein translocase subunit SecG [bacterium CG2_30_40_12]OJI09144.1 MAG: preprotein translocase subunit SecG [bacterium CG09_39_24]PIP04284.1 MAG: preprotein translocase subunit SecG [candidate division WWE3 bacterium CG23_combo_of_CG06-09_8_20_14_all_40_14]PIS12980.1 MAG: preprotein translocase subunit SecG [candidate division WWE3 bacterium CG09_land_8_20_14_0_10_39_24]PJE52252.1 MAG: preprotein translocase subunit SecG [candidate division WWE3 bacterium CG10_big_fil_rev_8_21_14_0_